MTVHERMESLADLLVAGGLSAEERAEIERHAAECASCGALIRDAREFASWAKGLIARDAPPADLEDRVIERFRASGQKTKRRIVVGKRVLKVTGSIAAAVGLIVLGNVFSSQVGALKNLTSAEADFRPNDGTRAFDGATVVDIKGKERQLHGMSGYQGGTYSLGEPTSTGNWFGYFSTKTPSAGGDTTASMLALNAIGKDGGLGLALNPSFATEVDQLRKNAELELGERSKSKSEGRFASHGDRGGEERAGKSTDLPDARDSASLSTTGFAGTLKDARVLNEVQKAETEKLAKLELSVAAEDAKAEAKPTPKPEPAAFWKENGELAKPSTTPATPQDNRKIIRNADVSLEVDSYDATYTKIGELAGAEKGFIASANTQKLANGKIQATVVVRVPPDRFEAVIAKLKDLGTVRHQNIGSEDVTKAYVDLESRLAGKQILATRLSKLLAEGKGTVKDLMEVEVQLGATNEAIEQLKGEIKFYDNRIGLSTLTLQIAEKDLGQPFEYVQSLQANLAITVRDPDDAYAKAQKEIADAGGQVVDSRMNRQNDGTSTGTIRARVDADKFQALRESLKKLGVPTNDTVNLQKTAQGGREGTPKADAPLRKEQAVLDLNVTSPPIFVTKRLQLIVETADVEGAYAAARKSAEGMGGKIVDGSLSGRADRMAAVLKIQADADKFGALMESLKTAGKVKNATVNSVLPATAADGGAALLRERAEIEFTLVSPPQLIAEENGLGKSIRDTLANSWGGLLWSIEKLFVGIALAGPWLIPVVGGIVWWRRRRKKAAPSP